MRDNRAGRVLRHVYPAPSKFAALIATPGPPGLTRRPENPVRRRWPPAGAARVSPATHTIS